VAVDVMELAGVGLDSVGDFQYLHSPDRPHFVSEYSTDIAAAWEVVEKLSNGKEDGRMMVWHFNRQMSGAWVIPMSWADLKGYIIADTAPLAICRAAIKATKESG